MAISKEQVRISPMNVKLVNGEELVAYVISPMINQSNINFDRFLYTFYPCTYTFDGTNFIVNDYMALSAAYCFPIELDQILTVGEISEQGIKVYAEYLENINMTTEDVVKNVQHYFKQAAQDSYDAQPTAAPKIITKQFVIKTNDIKEDEKMQYILKNFTSSVVH